MATGSGSVTPPDGKCRRCDSRLVRDPDSKKPRWHCTNIHCVARVKPGAFIGNVRVLGPRRR